MTSAATTPLTGRTRRFLLVLALPAFALSLAVTTVSALLPVLLEERAGPLVTGALIGSEGIMALVVPAVVGPWSDRTGKRLPFIAGAGLLAAGALIVIPLGGSLLVLGAMLLAFQVGYFAYFTPYWALYPDLVPEEARGRSQGSQGLFREVGLAVALVGGPLMLGLWKPLPFLLAAAVLLMVSPFFGAAVARRMGREGAGIGAATNEGAGARELLREHPAIGWFIGANALWETALGALRAFVVLFFIKGLDRPLGSASLVLALVAVAALVAAPLSGSLADRFGRRRVLEVALWFYAGGMIVPAFTQSMWILPVVGLGALAAVTVMTLPLALLMDLLPEGRHGQAAGLFGLSRGVGLLLGPLLAGLAITLLDGVFAETDGYASIFLVAAVALAASIPMLRCVRETS